MKLTIKKIKILFICLLTASMTPDAHSALVELDFNGVITQNSGLYSSGDRFTGSYTINTDVLAVEDMPFSVNWFNYYGAIEAFELNLAYNTISLSNNASGDIELYNDYYSQNTGSWYDRIITTVSDLSYTNGVVEFVQFDWQSSSTTGPAPGITSTDTPVITTPSNFDRLTGRISADGDRNIYFELDSIEASPVPLPGALVLFLSGLFTLLIGRKLSTH